MPVCPCCDPGETSGNVWLGTSLACTSQVLNQNAGVLTGEISHTAWARSVRPCTVQKGRILVRWDHRSTAGVLIRSLAFQYPECSSGFPSLFPCLSSEFPELAAKRAHAITFVQIHYSWGMGESVEDFWASASQLRCSFVLLEINDLLMFKQLN